MTVHWSFLCHASPTSLALQKKKTSYLYSLYALHAYQQFVSQTDQSITLFKFSSRCGFGVDSGGIYFKLIYVELEKSAFTRYLTLCDVKAVGVCQHGVLILDKHN